MRRSRTVREALKVLAIGLVGALGIWLMDGADAESLLAEVAGWSTDAQQISAPGPASGTATPRGPATILLVGDVLPLGDRDYFAQIADLTASADLTVGNLECSISTRGTRTELKLSPYDRALPNEYFFRAPPSQAQRLADAGFDALTMANNHIMDYGAAALDQTLTLLDDVGIVHAGAGPDEAAARDPALVQANGQTVALLAYVDADTLPATTHFAARESSAGTVFVHGDGSGHPREGTLKRLREDIGAARERADFVIVSFHWGEEGADHPERLQRTLAHRCIEAGADAVVGHHPHVLQGLEVYGGRPIIYSLGNFAFPTPWENNQFAAAAALEIEDGRWTKLTWHPVRLSNPDGVPAPATGVDARRIISRLTNLSAALGTEYQTTQDQSAPLWVAHEPSGPQPESAPESFGIEQHPEIDGMATVRFSAWDIEAGERVARERSVVVHQKLADEVLAIFREIYEADERFPIHEVIGYDYRTVAGSGDRLSWHATGRAIDINRAQNPMIEHGRKVVHPDEPPYEPGQWRPGEDPYSIPADGSVVKAFTSRGWRWGGNWTSVKDYQHFDKPR